MSAHTPGPWRLTDERGSRWVQSEIEDVVCRVFSSGGKARYEADSRLIAAAPDLLAALRAIVQSLADQDDEGLIEHAEPMIAARAAIARAEGRT
jgi:hypothetical protein